MPLFPPGHSSFYQILLLHTLNLLVSILHITIHCQILFLDNVDLNRLNKPHKVVPRLRVFDQDSLKVMAVMCASRGEQDFDQFIGVCRIMSYYNFLNSPAPIWVFGMCFPSSLSLIVLVFVDGRYGQLNLLYT